MPINLRQEEDVADFLLWISFLTALASGAFFTAQIKFGICGWEGAPEIQAICSYFSGARIVPSPFPPWRWDACGERVSRYLRHISGGIWRRRDPTMTHSHALLAVAFELTHTSTSRPTPD